MLIWKGTGNLIHRGQLIKPGQVFDEPDEATANRLVSDASLSCSVATDAEVQAWNENQAYVPPPTEDALTARISELERKVRSKNAKIAALEEIVRGKDQSPEINALKGRLEAANARIKELEEAKPRRGPGRPKNKE